MKVCVLQVFFLFSSTKIGHDRPSVKDRYAISDKNILRSCVVRYFYRNFLPAVHPCPWRCIRKKEKNVVGGAWRRLASSFLCLRPISAETIVLDYFIQLQLLATKLVYRSFEKRSSGCATTFLLHPALITMTDADASM